MSRWLAILCAALLVAGCGSSSGSRSTSVAGTATGTGTATPTVDSSPLKRLPKAPEPSDSRPISPGASRNAFLRAVFDDAEALWRNEFDAAGLTYRPARLTIFSRGSPHRVRRSGRSAARQPSGPTSIRRSSRPSRGGSA